MQVCSWFRFRDGCASSWAEIQDWCRHHLAYYKVPHYVCFIEGFPVTVTGNMQKFLMREAMNTELACALHRERRRSASGTVLLMPKWILAIAQPLQVVLGQAIAA